MSKYKYTQDQIAMAASSGLLGDREARVLELFYRKKWHIEDIAAEIGYERRTVCRDLVRIRAAINANADVM